MNISWKIGSHDVNATLEKTENVTRLKTEVLNSREPVFLTITGGQNKWLEKIEPGKIYTKNMTLII